MVSKFLLNLFGLHTSNGYTEGYDAGYHKGLADGEDFGKRIAYNVTLRKELPSVLSRYSQLQVKIINQPKSVIQDKLGEFAQQELDRFEMELQDR